MINDNIIQYLKKTKRYTQLIKNYEPQKKYGYAFEIYFAYVMEIGGLQLKYEKKPNPSSDKSVDFLFEKDNTKIWFELVSLDYNKQIKEDIESQLNTSNFYSITIISDHEKPSHDHARQITRLQDKILEKPIKFGENSVENINIIVVDCSKIHAGGFDKQDFENTFFGCTSISILNEDIDGKPLKGLFQQECEKRDIEEFQKKTNVIIAIKKMKEDLFGDENTFFTCNPFITNNEIYNLLIKIQPLKKIKYIPPPR